VSILVAGEALIDFFPANCGKRRGFVPFPGGSPLNVAVGLGRLGVPVGFLGKVSKDPFGRLLRSHLEESGVDLSYLKAPFPLCI
jgi:fructokinase